MHIISPVVVVAAMSASRKENLKVEACRALVLNMALNLEEVAHFVEDLNTAMDLKEVALLIEELKIALLVVPC